MTYNYDIILYEIMLNIYKLTNVCVFSFCLCNGFSSQILLIAFHLYGVL